MQHTLLEIKNVTKQYHQKGQPPIEALKGITLNIYSNEIITLLGVNGAGKSTLSSIIATLHPPTSGDIVFQGTSIYSNLIDYRSHLGFCPQRPNLDDTLTLEQNLRFAGRFYRMTEDAIDKRLSA
ncbi:MAG: ATP-binding cassette domain-containing protein, partial [Candidatus Babeliales bacterium]